MTPLLKFVLAAMLKLAPGRDHQVLAESVVRVLDANAPLFAGDPGKRKTAGLVVAVAFRESSLRADAVGDCVGGPCARGGRPRSFCAMQIHETSGGSPALLTNADVCFTKGLAMLRVSAHEDPAHPIAWYAGGPRGFKSEEARRVSRDRMDLARRLYTEVAP